MKRFFTTICMLLLLLAFEHPANATDYYVSTTGDNVNGGTDWADALLTIQQAVTLASSGDVIYVRDDAGGQTDFTGVVTIPSGKDGLQIIGTDVGGNRFPVLNGGGNSKGFDISSNNVTIQDFTIIDFTGGGFYTGGNGSGIYTATGTFDHVFTGNKIDNCGWGIYCVNTSNTQIIGNEIGNFTGTTASVPGIHYASGTGGVGVYLISSGSDIESNTVGASGSANIIKDCEHYGVALGFYGSNVSADLCSISYNTISGCGNGTTGGFAIGLSYVTGQVSVSNNTLSANYNGFYADGTLLEFYLADNAFNGTTNTTEAKVSNSFDSGLMYDIWLSNGNTFDGGSVGALHATNNQLVDNPDNYRYIRNTIQSAISDATTNERVYIVTGTYTENVTVNVAAITFGNSGAVTISGNLETQQDLTLDGQYSVTGTLTLNGGDIAIGDNDFTVTGTITPNSNVIKTPGAGYLATPTVVATTAYQFPLANDSYSFPATITCANPSGNPLKAKLLEQTPNEARSGDDRLAIEQTWDFVGDASLDATVKFEWPATTPPKGTSFNTANTYAGLGNGGNWLPQATGITRTATSLEITSVNTFSDMGVFCWADGHGNYYALQDYPDVQARSIQFTDVKDDEVSFSWTNGNGDYVIVLGREGSAPETPVNGTEYNGNADWSVSDTYGSGNLTHVLYRGSNATSTLTVTNLNPATTYYFEVLAVNGTSTQTYYSAETGSYNPRSRLTKSQAIFYDVTPATLCEGGTATLDINVYGNSGTSNIYVSYNDGTANFTNNTNTSTSFTISHPGISSGAGTFNLVSVRDRNNKVCELYGNPQTITVTPGIQGNTISAAQEICNGATPTALDGATPTGGTGSYTYLWEESTTSATTGFSTASGTSDAEDYSPPALTATTWYRRTVTSGDCSDVSTALQIIVNPVLANNTVSTAQEICNGDTPAALTGTTPTGGNGTYTYEWQSSTTNATTGFTPASGTINQINYTPPALSATTWYRRKVTSGGCEDISDAIEMTVNPVITGNTVSAAQTVCEGDTPAGLTGSAPGGGNGSYTYLWESSTTSNVAGFAAASGTNNTQSYTPGSHTITTWYRRTVTSGGCEDVSSAIEITVTPAIANNTVSSAQEICNGATPAALTGTTPTGGTGSYTYLWESSTTSASAGFASADGTNNTINYTPGSHTITTWYRRTVTSGVCSDISPAIEITVNPVLADNTIGTAQEMCTGDTPTALTGSVPTGGNGTYTYLWEESTTNATTGFASASGTYNTQNYTPGALTATTWYRRTVTSGGCTDVTAAIEMTVNPVIANNTVTAPQDVCDGNIPNPLDGATPTGGNGSYTYEWQSSTTSATTGFAAASGTITDEDYNPPALSATTWYRRQVSSGGCIDISTAIEMTVSPVLANNTIGSAQEICIGQTPAAFTGSIPTGGNGAYTYLWESSTTNATTGFASASGTNNTQNYTSGALVATTWFRRKVSSGGCEDYSTAIQVTVNPVISGNSISAAQIICTSTAPAALTGSSPTGGNGGYTYLWESSTTSSTTGFAPADGTNNAQNYTPGVLTATTWYRRTVTSGGCSDVTAAIEITVNPVIANNTISSAQEICTGQTPAVLLGSLPTGGDGIVYTYLWESSTTSASAGFGAADGTNTGSNYAPGSHTITTWYRRVVTSGGCTDNSAAIEITVNPVIANNTVTADQEICTGDAPATFTGSAPTGGNGTYTYEWETSTTNATTGFSTAGGTFNEQNYTSATISATTWYRRKVTSGGCEDYSTAVQVTVNPVIADNTISSGQEICTGVTPAGFTGSSPTGGNGSYTYLWESSTTSATAGFASASGTNNAQNYTAPAGLTATTWYRRTVTSGGCTDVSSPIQVIVNPDIADNTVSTAQEICTGTTPTALTGSSPSGGNGTYTYLWEESTTNATTGFGSASGTNNTQNYTPGSLTATTWYRRTVTSGGCTNTSTAIEITVNPDITGNTVSSAQEICTGTIPAGFTGSAPGGGNSSYSYLWESSTTDATSGFAAAAGTNNAQDYTAPSALTATTWYRRTVTSGGCTNTSTAIQVTVNPAIAGNTVSAAQEICSGQTPAAFTGSSPTGGNGSYTYLWESSTTSATTGFGSADGTNNTQNYTPGSHTITTWYRRVVTSGGCTDNSAAIQITVNPVIANNTGSSAQVICQGDTPAGLTGSTPTGGNNTYAYLWESSTTNATTGFSTASGTVNTIDYTPPALNATTWYRRTVTSGGCTDVSTAIEITVNPPIANNTVSSTQTICYNQTPAGLTGTLPTGGSGSYTYLWESSTTSSTTGFATVAGTFDGQNYTPGSHTVTTWYRRTVTSGGCSDISGVIEITVLPAIANNTATADQLICAGNTPATLTGSTPTGGNSAYSYLWESSTTNATTGFTSASGINNGQNYSPGILSINTWYRRTVTSGPCSDVSTAVAITVTPIIGNNTISAAQEICSGQTPAGLTGSAPTGGTGSFTYLWEESTTSATTGFASANGTNNTQNYTPGTLTATTWYRRSVISGGCTDITSAIEITVNPPIANNTVSAAQEICNGDTPATLTGSTPTGGNGSYAYLWESSTTSATTGFASAAGTNTAIDYTAPAGLTATTWYRRVVTSDGCTDNSTAVQITVNPVIANNTVSSAQEICTGTTPAVLTGSAPSGGNGTYTYLWESSTTNATTGFATAAGTSNEQNYTPGTLTATTWYRRTVTSGGCSDVATAIEITVNPVISGNTIGSAQEICTGTIPAGFTGAAPGGGNGSYAYLWESSTTSATAGFASAAGTNDQQNYTAPSALTATTWYRRTVTSGGCTDVSTAVQVIVNPVIANNTIGSAQEICTGDTPAAFTGSTPTGGNNTYTYLWESSTTNATTGFASASGTNNTINYTPGSHTVTTWYRRTVTSGGCTDNSTAIQITVNPVIAGNTVSAAQTICENDTPAGLSGSAPSGGNGSYTYLWESSTTSSTTGFATASGTSNQQNYTPAALAATTWYRRTVTSGGCTDVSSAIEITVQPLIAGNTIGTAQEICTGTIPAGLTGASPTGGSGSYTYLWESSTTSATAGFAGASGTNNTQNYTPGTLTATTWYRRTVTSGACSDVSTAIQITVNPSIASNSVSAAQTICSGATPAGLTGSTPIGGNNTYTYLWEESTTNATTGFTSASGTNNTINYTPGTLTATTWYRRYVTSGGCTDYSTAIEITVNPVIAGNTIGSAQEICTGTAPAALTGAVPTGGDGSTYTYYWESSTTSATTGFAAAPGANTNQNYSPIVLTQDTWFRRRVTSGGCTDYSSAVMVTVNPVIADNSVSAAQEICTGQTPAALAGSTPTGGNNTYTYLWESSTTSASAGFASASGTNNTINYTPGSHTITTWYRRYVTSGGCEDYSTAIQITVNPVIAGNTVSSAQEICTGTTPAGLTGSSPTGGNGTYAYLWESSTTSATTGFATATGTSNTIDYTPGTLTQTTWYRRTVTSGGCSDVSTAIQITVNPAITGNSISSAQAICEGDTPAALSGTTPSGGNGSYTYLWEESTTSATTGFGSATGTNNAQNYTPGTLSATTWYRRTVTSGGCTNTSSAIAMTVTPAIVGNTIGSAQDVCYSNTPNPLTGALPTGGNSSYTYLWETSTTNATTGFNPASGTNNEQNYTPVALYATTWVRRTVTSGSCTDVSSVIELTVHPQITNNSVTANQEICTGTTPAQLTGSAPSGGDGSYTYEWQSSTTSATTGFAQASGTFSDQHYQPEALGATTWFRRAVSSGGCTDYSTAVQITVNPVIANNTASSAQEICTGTAPAALTGSTPTGGNNTYSYLWQESTTSATTGFASASGTNTTQNYSPGTLTATTWYRRYVSSGGCEDYSTAIQITVNPAIANNTVSSAQEICTGTTPAGLTGSTPTGGNNTYTYLWESSTTSATTGFATASGTSNTIDYTPGALTATTWYRRTVTSGGCTDVSTAIQITVNPAIANNSVSSAQEICTGSTPAGLTGTTPTGGNSTYTYLWESSTTSATAGFATASGTSDAIDYTPGALTATTWYRRTVSSGGCEDVSTAIQITVNPDIANNTVSSAQAICTGDTPAGLTGTSPSGGNGTYSYLWEESTTNATTGFGSATGTNNELNYSPGALTATTWYRRTVTSGGCTNTSAAIEMTVSPAITGNTIGSAQEICTGQTPAGLTGAAPGGGNGSYTYLWESSTTSATTGFASASGTNDAQDYTPGALTATTWYRRVVTSGGCSNTSAALEITVNPDIANNSVSSAQEICTGTTPSALTGTSPTGGNGTYTYLWESSTTSASAGFASADGTNNTINFTPGSHTVTTWYRRTVASGGCSNTSTAIEITVNPVIAGNTVGSAQEICTGSTPAGLTGSAPSGGNNTYSYLWESSTTSATTGFTSASGTNNTQNYTPGALTATTWYRRTVSSGGCTDASAAIEITVNPDITGNTVASAQEICTGQTPAALTGSAPSGGNGSYTYLWESSTTSSTAGFGSAGGTNNTQNYTPPGALTTTTWYRRTVTSGGCTNTSTAIEITVNPDIANNTVGSNQAICTGTTAAGLSGSSPTGGNGTFSYEWQSSTTNATTGFATAGGTYNTQNYIPGTLTATTWYRRVVTSGGCSNTSTAIEITVSPVIADNTIGSAQEICTGSTPASLTGSTPTGGNGSYTYLWEESTTSATTGFASATGTNNAQSYSPGTLTTNTWYRRKVSSGGCEDYSAVVLITVNPDITNNTASSAQAICSGATPATLTGTAPSGGNGTYTYLWEVSTTSATTGFSAASGTNNEQNYSPGSLTADTWYRRTVTSGGCTNTSTAILMDVSPAIADNTIGSAQSICNGNTPAGLTGSSPTGGNGSYAYQWESSTTDGSSGFSAASGTNNTQNYSPAVLTATTWYRRKVSSGGCDDYSSSIEITVSPAITNNTASSAQQICVGSTPAALTGTAPGGGDGSYTYQWESSTFSSSSGFANASGTSDGQNYTPGALSTTTWYRRVVASGGCFNTSAAIEITVNPVIAGNTVSTAQSICAGEIPTSLAGALPSGGNGTYTYLWEESTTNATTGFATATGTSNTQNYSPGSLSVTTWYRRTVTSGGCTDVSTAIEMTVTPVIAGNTIGSDQEICSGSTPAGLTGSSPTGGTGSFAYLWESSTTSATTGFSAASGTNNAQNYSPATLTQNTWYRRTVSSGACSDASNAILITVNPAISNNTASSAQSICSGDTPAGLTGTTPGGGNGTFSYEWQSSTTNATTGFATASGTYDGINYTPAALTATTWYRRVVTSGGCTDNSTAIEITVTNTIANNSVSSAQTVCADVIPAGLTGTSPTGGNGSFAYLWESSTTSATTGFASASGTNNQQNYSPGLLSSTTWFRRTVTSGGCSDVSTAIEITIVPAIANNTVASAQSICYNTTPAGLTGTTPTGGTGSYTYLWESSTTSATTGFSSASGTNDGQNYTPGVLTATTWYRRSVTSGICDDVSAAIEITVTDEIANNTISSAQSICGGETPGGLSGSAPTGGNGSFTYLWESSTTSGTTGFTSASGTNTGQNYSPGALSQTTWYRRVVYSGGCSTTSTAIEITVTPAISGNTIASSQTICVGNTPAGLTGAVPTGGTGTFAYEWQSSTTGPSSGFATASGTNDEQNYSPGSLSVTTWYRRVVTSGACTDISTAVQITTSPAITNNTVSSAQTICAGTTPSGLTGTTPGGGNGTFTYLWESSTTSSTTGFASASGTNNEANYTPGTLSQTTWFRRTVTSGGCTDISSAIAITITPAISGNTVGSAQEICTGTIPSGLTGAAPSGGTGSYTYVWQSSTTSATTGFTSAAGTNNQQNYSPGALTQTTWYRRSVTSGVCNDISTAVQITVNPEITNNTVSSSQTICYNTAPATLSGSTPSGGNGNYTYLWEYSTTSATSGFASASGTNTGQNYTSGALTVDTWFRRVVNSDGCSNTSPAIMMTITPSVTNNTISSAQTICAGDTPTSLTGTTPSGGTGSYTYQWQYSITSATSGFVAAPGTNNGQNYTPAALYQTTWVRRRIVSGGCTDFSNAIQITVHPQITNNVIGSNQGICAYSTPATLTGGAPGGGNGTYTYLWQYSTTSATSGFNTAPGTYNGQNYSPPALTATTWYRRYISSGECTNVSSAVQITVYPSPEAEITPSPNASYCTGQTVTLYANTGTNLAYQWRLDGTNIPGATNSTYAAGTAGNYTVVVTNTSTGCSTVSSATQVAEAGGPPNAPAQPTASSVMALEFTIGWTAVTSATGYFVDVATDADFTNILSSYDDVFAGVNSINVNLGISRNTTYYYRVRAMNGCGTSANSTYNSVLTTNPVITVTDSDPYNFGSVAAGTCSGSPVSYSVSATGLDVDLTITPPAGYKLSLNGSDYLYDNSSPLEIAKDGSGNISNTTIWLNFCPTATGTFNGNITHISYGAVSHNTAVTGTGVLASPDQPWASNVSTFQFNVNWDAVTGATGYRIDVSSNSGFTSILASYNNLDVGNTTSVTVATGIARGTQYWFRVRAYDGNGPSASSTANTVTTYDPTIIVTASDPYNFGNVGVGGTSGSPVSYTVQGATLEADLVVTPPAYYKLSTNGTNYNYDNSNPLTLTRDANGNIASTTIYAEFYPTTTGTLSGNITHASTNATQDNVSVTGVGIAGAPTTQASNITFSSDNGTDITTAWTQGNGAYKLVVMCVGEPVTWTPTNGTEYTAGTSLGSNHYVVAVKTNTDSQTQTISSNISAGQDIWIKIWEYNGTGSSASYLTSGFVSGSNPARPLYLDVTSANNGNSIVSGTQFFMTVESQDRSGDAVNTTASKQVTMTYSGGGSELGTITTGNSNVTIYETISDAAGTGKSLTFTATGYFSYVHNFTLYAATPAQQSYFIIFNTVTCNSINFRFYESADADNELVVYKAGATPDLPTDGSSYTPGQTYGTNTVVAYAGDYNNGNLTISSLDPSTTYYIRSFAYNGTGTLTSYNTSTASLNPRSTMTPACRGADLAIGLELEGFHARSARMKVYTNWETYVESGILGFEVYRARVYDDSDELDFVKVGSYTEDATLEGSYDSYGKSYTFVDDDPELGIGEVYLYKLVYVGIDGEEVAVGEDIVTILSSSDGSRSMFVTDIKPQPADDYITFVLELEEQKNISVELYEASGRTVLVPFTDKSFDSGANEVKIEFDEKIASGTYILQISSGDETVSKKIIIHR